MRSTEFRQPVTARLGSTGSSHPDPELEACARRQPGDWVSSDGRSDPQACDVWRAIERVGPLVVRTPLVFSEHCGAYLKLENLQRTGAYKVRGALNALMIATRQGDRRPIVAASAGNHARGMAWAARRLGLKAVAVVPHNAPRSKVEGTIELGAEVIRAGDSFEAAFAHALQLSQSRGWRLLHPFDDPDVIAGQGTIAAEIMEARPDVVVVPIGGGGLISGMGLYLNGHGVRVVGAQVEGMDAMGRSLEGAAPLVDLPATAADGLRVRRVGERTERICRRVVDEVIRVTEEEVRQAIADLAVHDRVVAEGAGAVAVAALRRVEGERRVAVVTGGNIDQHALVDILGGHRGSDGVGSVMSHSAHA